MNDKLRKKRETLIKKEGSLADNYPEILKYWDYNKNIIKPYEITSKTHEEVYWKCPDCGYSWKNIVREQIKRKGCPKCNLSGVFPGINDLATINPFLAKQWHPTKNGDLKPSMISARSGKKVWWICDKGHEWEAAIGKRSDGQGCPYCCNKSILIGFNDLRTTNPELIEEWDFSKNIIKPEEVTAGSSQRVWWKCKECGNEWETIVRLRALNKTKCPKCAKKISVSKAKKTYVIKHGSLADTNPDVLDYWDYDKNTISPNEITAGVPTKVFWKCPVCGYEWEQQISKKVKINKCPKCALNRVIEGENDLATINPILAKQWHPTKNGYLTPSLVTAKSGKKVWWQCEFGHEYKAVIRDRNEGTGCPICNRYLSSSFPEQAIYYCLHDIFNDTTNRYSPKFLKPMEIDIYIPSLKLGIEYDGCHWHNSEQSHINELKKYELCKKNNIKLVRVKEMYPKLWHDSADFTFTLKKNPSEEELTKIITKIINLINKEYDLFIVSDVNITRDRQKILTYLVTNNNSLAQLYPEIAEEWHPTKNGDLKPGMFAINSNEKVWWKCKKCGHEWITSINQRTPPRSSGCPICSLAKRSKSFHDNYIKENGSIVESNPTIMEEWNYEKNSIDPHTITSGCNHYVWWKCKKCGYEWETSPGNRLKGIGCPRCSGRVPTSGVNDLQTLYPDIASEWHPTKNGDLKPIDILPGSGRLIWWKCKRCGYEWQDVVRNRVKRRHNCPYCNNKGIIQISIYGDENDK